MLILAPASFLNHLHLKVHLHLQVHLIRERALAHLLSSSAPLCTPPSLHLPILPSTSSTSFLQTPASSCYSSCPPSSPTTATCQPLECLEIPTAICSRRHRPRDCRAPAQGAGGAEAAAPASKQGWATLPPPSNQGWEASLPSHPLSPPFSLPNPPCVKSFFRCVSISRTFLGQPVE